jgi:biopolymer transport protein TolR
MSMDVGAGKGGVKSDINVTPLVDVMLVLLIIMMIVAPMLQQGVPVSLPGAANRVDKPDTQDQVVVSVTADGRLHLNTLAVTDDDLPDRAKEALENAREKIVYLKADKDAAYGRVMAAMDALRKAAIEDIGLIADPKMGAGQAAGGGE